MKPNQNGFTECTVRRGSDRAETSEVRRLFDRAGEEQLTTFYPCYVIFAHVCTIDLNFGIPTRQLDSSSYMNIYFCLLCLIFIY